MDVTGDNIPEIFIMDWLGQHGTCVNGFGNLRALQRTGSTLSQVWVSPLIVNSYSAAAIAHVPNTSITIICAVLDTLTAFGCFNAATGNTVFTQPIPNNCPGVGSHYAVTSGLAIEKLYSNDPNNIYILSSGMVFRLDATLTPTLNCSISYSGFFQMPFAMDIDLDGIAEIFFDNCVYRADCTLYWCTPTPPASIGCSSAVANMDADPFGEVVFVCDGVVRAYNHDNTPLWTQVILPTFNYYLDGGGPPALADMTGDGIPDVIVSNFQNFYVLSGTNGAVLLNYDIITEDSCVTTTVAFDFQKDGVSEAVYCDLSNCHIFGLLPFFWEKILPNPGITASESVAIVDIDWDGVADIVSRGNTQLSIYSSVDLWSGTKRTWNKNADSGLDSEDLLIVNTVPLAFRSPPSM